MLFSLLYFLAVLLVVGQPFTLRQLHIRKNRFERGIPRAAGIDTKADFAAALVHMADSHLAEAHAILGAFHAVVILPSAEPIPHGFHIGTDLGGCPIGIAQIGDHSSQVLKPVVFVLDGCL